MNEHDYAIIVGIQHYPGVSHLSGPLNDADDFKKWLLDTAGGQIPEDNITMVCHKYEDKDLPGLNVYNANPTRDTIRMTFEKLNAHGRAVRGAFDTEELEQKSLRFYMDADDHCLYAGRRLYLFFAGHGLNDKNVKNNISLLAANGNYNELANQGVDAFHCLDFYEKSGYFKEVVLITDCCRIPKMVDNANHILLPDPANPFRKVRTNFMISCQDGQAAREMNFEGRCNGVFSKILLEALAVAKSNQENRGVTYQEINSYIANNKHRFSGSQTPVIHGNEYGSEITIVERASNFGNRFEIQFVFPDEWIGGVFSIAKANHDPLITNVTITVNMMSFKLPLEILRFKANFNGQEKSGIFEIESATKEMKL